MTVTGRFRVPSSSQCLGVAALLTAGAAAVVFTMFWLAEGLLPPWYAVVTVVLLVVQWLTLTGGVRLLEVSDMGLIWPSRWRSTSRPWTDFRAVGILAPSLGGGASVIVAQLAESAPKLSTIRRPLTAPHSGQDSAEVLANLAIFTSPGAEHPAWDIPDDDLVAAVRAHAGDRWTETFA